MKYILVSFLALSTLVSIFGQNSSSSVMDIPPETTVVDSLVQLLDIYADDHGGKIPRSWEEFSVGLDFDPINKGLPDYKEYPLQERYSFINQPVSLLGKSKSRIILVRTSPVQLYGNADPEGRFVVYREENKTSKIKLPESKIQEMFKASGVSVPQTSKVGRAENSRPSLSPDKQRSSVPSDDGGGKNNITSNQVQSMDSTKSGYLNGFVILAIVVAGSIVGALVFYSRRR
jgi:hypothetical protein